MSQRTIPVTVKMSQEDLDRFLECQHKNWPGVPITRSTLVLTLARMGCEWLEKQAKGKKPKVVLLWACLLPAMRIVTS
jgi:hypothetical protein